MAGPDIIFGTVNGPYGQVTQEMNKATLHFRYSEPPNGAQGEFKVKDDSTWRPIPEGGTGIPVVPGNIVELRSVMGGLVAQQCEKVEPESPSRVTFQFNWTEPNTPSVTIEVEEMGITDE